MAGLFGNPRGGGQIRLFGSSRGIGQGEQRRLADLAAQFGGSSQSRGLPSTPFPELFGESVVAQRNPLFGGGGSPYALPGSGLPFPLGTAGDPQVLGVQGAMQPGGFGQAEAEAEKLRPAAFFWEGEDRPTQFMRPVTFQNNFKRTQDRAIAQEQARRTGGNADETNKVVRVDPDPAPMRPTPRGLETWTVQFGRRTYSKQLPAGATDAQVRAAFADEYRQAGIEVGRAAVQRPAPKQPKHEAKDPSTAPPAGDSRNRSDRGGGVGAGVGLASRTAAVGIGSERARTNYKRLVNGLEESDEAGRELAKAYVRAATPREVRAIIKATRPGLGPQPGSGGRANVTNAAIDQAAKNLGRIGRGAGVIGIGLAATDIATSNDPLRATVANVAAGVGGVVGGAGGAALGSFGGPAAFVTAPAGGIAGSIAGGNVGYRVGERVYDWLAGY